MNILAMDTSGPVAGVAVMAQGKIVYEGAAVNRMTHSVNLIPMVEEALTRSGIDVASIDLFAAVTGPGSFTGVRIGVSTVKGMAHGADKPCIGIDALEALAAGMSAIPSDGGILCPIQDARAGQVYGAAFSAGMPPLRLIANQAAKLPDFVEQVTSLCAQDTKLYFAGDGAPVHREALTELLGERACFMPAHLSFLRPASVVALADVYADRAVDYLSLAPRYLRAPQAERERAARLKGQTV